MRNQKTSANLPGTKLPGKAVMKRLGHLAFAFCLLTCVGFSASLWGQAAASDSPGTEPNASANNASQAQPDASAKTPHADDTYIIGDGDVLSINVWKDLDLTRSVPVRSDGRISLPLVGDLQAAGRTPAQLEQDLTTALRGFITDPQVTVIVQEINSRKFNILGQVLKPGSYPLTADTTVVDAIALAGGFKDFAKKKGIYVVRLDANGAEIRIGFNYDDFIKGKHAVQSIQLQPHDTVVVP
jgi:polysaccharide export outer membrane protein